MDKENRIGALGYYSFAKGIGMIMVLWFHSMTAFFPAAESSGGIFAGAGSVVGGGIMAMFYMMSGDGFYKRSTKKCISIQKKILLQPYFLSAAAVLLTKLLLTVVERRPFWDHGGVYLPTFLLGLNAEGGGVLFGIPVESVSIFWFVLALFGGWILYNAILQNKKKEIQNLLIVFCVIAGWSLNLISRVWPFCLSQVLLVVGYLAAGVSIRQNDLLTKKLSVWNWAVILAVAGVCAAWGSVNIVAGVWGLGLLDVAGSFCWGFLLLRLYARWMELEHSGKLFSMVESVGFYSLWVVCLHGYEKIIVPWYRLGAVFPGHPLLCALLCLVSRSVVLYMMYRIISGFYGAWRGRRRKPKIMIE